MLTINTINQNTNDETVEGKIIRKAAIANELLDKGHRITHLKADRNDADHKRSVFVFEKTPELEKDLDEIMKRRRQDREADFEERVRREVEARLKAMSEE